MKTTARIAVLLAATSLLAVPAFADPMVGGAAMSPSKNIVENASQSRVSTTLVKAVQAAGLVQTLEGQGPFTVFAPTNAAFDRLPSGELNTLLEPANRDKLANLLKYHVVAGALTTEDLQAKIKQGGGKAMLKTVEGDDLIAEDKGGKIELLGADGSRARITIANVRQSNGVIQVVDGVLLPG